MAVDCCGGMQMVAWKIKFLWISYIFKNQNSKSFRYSRTSRLHGDFKETSSHIIRTGDHHGVVLKEEGPGQSIKMVAFVWVDHEHR